jgi:2-C-methyl-D-erythritol 2,4-cyclodiphosphate synthase/2-C-methyl-D-erythritol 4-phosphate cytidylyltransferase
LYKKYIFAAIIVAAGESSRMKTKIRKPFLELASKPIICYSLEIFNKINDIKEIIVVAQKDDEEKILKIVDLYKIHKFKKVAIGSKTRQGSVFSGVLSCSNNITHFVIHDSARPLISKKVVVKILNASKKHNAVAVCNALNDTIKKVNNEGYVEKTINRKDIFKIQTPQAFEKSLYLKGMNTAIKNKKDYTDDCQLIENINEKVFLLKENEINFKITKPEDLEFAQKILNKKKTKVGYGYDLHPLIEGKKLIIGGVCIPHNKGLSGHSDADVLTHAIIDALLGAFGAGDIGNMFPDTEKKYKNINSIKLLKKVYEKVKKSNYELVNIDCCIVAQKPKLSPYVEEMKENISNACGFCKDLINIKASTDEGLGISGEEKAIYAHVVCLID